MRILLLNLILSTAEKGVITRRKSIKDCTMCNFARGLVDNGHAVTILAMENFKPTEKEEYPFNVVYFKPILSKVFKPAYLPLPKGFRKFLKANVDNFDMVISVETFSFATLLAADIFKGKMMIWQELSLHQRKFFKLPSRFWYNVIARFYLRNIYTIGNTEQARDFISQYMCNVDSETICHGANGDLLKPSNDLEKYFVVVARLVKGKNIDKIISRFAEFVSIRDYSDYKLFVIGDGEEKENLEKIITEEGVNDNVKLLGFLRHYEMADILNKAIGLLIESSKDLSMVSIPEAIISGTPILLNTVPCSHLYVRKYDLGIVKDDWDKDELIEMINRYQEFHKNCIAYRDKFTSVGVAKRMVELFSANVLDKGLN